MREACTFLGGLALLVLLVLAWLRMWTWPWLRGLPPDRRSGRFTWRDITWAIFALIALHVLLIALVLMGGGVGGWITLIALDAALTVGWSLGEDQRRIEARRRKEEQAMRAPPDRDESALSPRG